MNILHIPPGQSTGKTVFSGEHDACMQYVNTHRPAKGYKFDLRYPNGQCASYMLLDSRDMRKMLTI